MGIFYSAVFMADAQVIDRWLHAVVLAQRRISLREFLLLVRIEVRGTQAVGAMFLGRAAEFMQGGLQTIGQRTITFPAPDDMNSTPMTICQAKLIQQVIKWLTRDRNCRARPGKIGQPLVPGRHRLAENDSLPGTLLARQCFTRRCKLLSNFSGYWPGYRSSKYSQSVVPVSSGSRYSNGTNSVSQTSAKGSWRVRHCRCDFSTRTPFSILRPLRILIPAFSAAVS